MKNRKLTLDKLALTFILLISGFLNIFFIWKEGYGNNYYAAAVRSMLQNFHAFFFASLDPAGFVTVDKPPVALWLQTLSASIFGFKGWSLLLPEGIAGVISVAIIYHLVKRSFGTAAGLISAFILAVTPIFVAVSRTNNVDAILVMITLFAAWALIAAAEKGSLKLLLLSAALVGLGFNVKMLEAYMILPSFFVVYCLSPLKRKNKFKHLTAALAVLIAVSLSWALIVDFTPAEKRPFVGSSQTNSVIELAICYNGIQRILPSVKHDNTSLSSKPKISSSKNSDIIQMPNQSDINRANKVSSGRKMGSGGEGGTPGILRLFNKQMAGQISWLFPIAFIGIFAALKSLKKDDSYKRQNIILWILWVVPMLVYFSISGFLHRYYLSMLAPGIAAFNGIGIIAMWKSYLEEGWKGWFLPFSLIANCGLQIIMLSRYEMWNEIMIPIICVLSLSSSILLIIFKLISHNKSNILITVILFLGIIGQLISPSVWSLTPIIYGDSSQLPYAGPELSSVLNSRNIETNTDSGSQKFIGFLEKNRKGEKYILAVSNAMNASSIIIKTGDPVMAMGGFTGSDPILTLDKFKNMVKNGDVRYVLIQGVSLIQTSGSFSIINSSKNQSASFGGADFGKSQPLSEIDKWVEQNSIEVPIDEWSPSAADGNNKTKLFDLSKIQ